MNVGQGLKIWPPSYERRDYISKAEKELSHIFERKVDEGHLILQAYPSTLSGRIRISFYIHNRKGVLAILISEADEIVALKGMMTMADVRVREESTLYQRLSDSKQLISYSNGKKLLKFPFRLIYYFTELNMDDVKNDKMDLAMLAKSGIFVNDTKRGQTATGSTTREALDLWFANPAQNFDTGFEMLSEADRISIIERLAPEYAIVLPEKQDIPVEIKAKPRSEKTIDITGKEHEFRTFNLDEEQVELVNDIKRGHQLILANAGAGKSVILLAKSYRIADLFPDSKVLLICYNKNLAHNYLFKSEIAGYDRHSNLHIDTFHAFVKKLDPSTYNINGLNNFDSTIEAIQKKIDKGGINFQFKAIFIDEVQMFSPKWIDLCYSLLDNGPESFFVIAGDLNQDVQNKSKRGKAVWQQTKLIPSPGFRGRTRYLRKNYRNSKEICAYLNKMLDFMISKFSSLNVIDRAEYDYMLHGEATRGGPPPIIKNVNRERISRQIVDEVNRLHEVENIPYNEIAIVFPYRQNRGRYYYIFNWIKRFFDEGGIPYSVIMQDEQGACKLIEADGVVLSTIDSALGLDFRALILAGLHPIDYGGSRGGAAFQERITWQNILRDPELQEQYITQMRKIYTACSRAREHLIVLNDLERGSPFSDFINVNDGGNGYGQ